MNMQQKEFIRFIKLLSDNDLLKHVILVGSWAEFLYKEARVLKGFEANIKTLDIDFLLKNLRRPEPPQNIVTLSKDAGYLVETDIMDGTTKILDKEGLEIEFLINKLGSGLEDTMKTNLGVTAQALRHMDILINNAIEVRYIDFDITVPCPEAYAIHKMVINKERKSKRGKDALAIRNIWPFLDKPKLNEICIKLTKKELKQVEAFMTEYGLDI